MAQYSVWGFFVPFLKKQKAKSKKQKAKTTAHSIPVWSPTTVLTVPSLA
jgi:hypothetical protein